MKKNLFNLMAVAMLCVMAMVVVSCDEDDQPSIPVLPAGSYVQFTHRFDEKLFDQVDTIIVSFLNENHEKSTETLTAENVLSKDESVVADFDGQNTYVVKKGGLYWQKFLYFDSYDISPFVEMEFFSGKDFNITYMPNIYVRTIGKDGREIDSSNLLPTISNVWSITIGKSERKKAVHKDAITIDSDGKISTTKSS